MADIYRKSSLEKLSSPDKLDCMLVVASPMSILVIAAAAVLCIAVIVWSFIGSIPEVVTGNGVVVGKYGVSSVFSPEGGEVTNVYVQPGQAINVGDPVIELRTPTGGTYTVTSDQSGIVSAVRMVDDYGNQLKTIPPFTELIRVIPNADSDLLAVCYIPVTEAEKIKKGMDANIFMAAGSGGDHISGTVVSVDSYASKSMAEVIGADMAQIFTQNGPAAAVVCSIGSSDKMPLAGGELLSVRIVTEQNAPIVKIFPFMKS